MKARTVALALLVGLLATFAATPAVAAPRPYVLYYQVQKSYQGHPEDLFEIATRFLGDAGRAGEILDLNTGRVQPDGDRPADPGSLHAGWKLLLPWDAVGSGVKYGAPPKAGKATADCAPAGEVTSAASWGQTLLTPSRAWSVADGSGVRVAVVGPGVDAASKPLAGRVTTAVDITAGDGTGCTGTAIAGIVAGDDGDSGKHFGVAPGATVVPVQVAAKGTKEQTATAIQVAAASGARVITVGAGLDTGDPVVRAAIDKAIAQDVVVVVPASSATAQGAEGGLLRVGGVDGDRKPDRHYPAGSLDVVAPGVKVATIGRTATGAEYAAAFVAGTVALLRPAPPALRAAEVTRQVLRTTSAPGPSGAGLVDPFTAVGTSLPARPDAKAGPGVAVIVLWVLGGLAVAAVAGLLLLFGVRELRSSLKARATRRAQLTADQNDPFWSPPSDSELPTRENITS